MASAGDTQATPRGSRRRLIALSIVPLGLVLLLGAANPVQASCKTPLPNTDLWSLDASADADPAAAIAAARSQLAAGNAADALRSAELYAIIADAYDTLNDDVEARVAISAGNASLAALPPGPAVEALTLRLVLVAADAAENTSDLTEAVRSLTERESRVAARSLGQACLFLVRSRVLGRLNQQDLAAKDGFLAYRIAVEIGASDAVSEAAYQLSMTFQGAGLFEEGLRMVDEAIAAMRKKNQTAALANALWQRAFILGEMGEPQAALTTLSDSRRLVGGSTNEIDQAFAERERCRELLALKRNDEAETACRSAESGFRSAGRADQAAAMQGLLARIDLIGDRPQRAVARLKEALQNGGQQIPPKFLPALYRDLSDALARTGRAAAALAALRESSHLSERADQLRRGLAVAVLNARQQADLQEQTNQALSRQIAAERAQAASRELSRRLAIALAVAAILLSLLIGRLLYASRRYARELRHRETILRETSDNAPDALVLLDASGRTRFANRSLFGIGETPGVDRPLADCVPPEACAPIAAAVTDLVIKRQPISIDISLAFGNDARDFELRGVPIVEQGQLLGATLRASDVTELRTLERLVLDAASQERQRLSSDLHEGLGQELTGVSLLLQTAITAAQRERPGVLELMQEALAQVARAVATTRDLARGFSPVQIERGSLSVALDRLALDAQRRLRIRVTSSSQPPDIRVSDLAADHLYRIAYESVTNAARHSGCSHVAIDLRREARTLRLTVSDDGSGFSHADEPTQGLGTRMMAYRARVLGGTVRFEATAGGGTRVVTSVPSEGDD